MLKFPVPEHIETLVESASILKSKYLRKSDGKAVPKKEVESSSAPVSKKQNANWMSNSISFFSSGPQVKTVVTDGHKSGNSPTTASKQTESKSLSSGFKTSSTATAAAADKVAVCIEILEKERAKYSSGEIEKCIRILKETMKELK